MPLDVERLVEKTVEAAMKYFDEKLDLYRGNRYLVVAIEKVLHEAYLGYVSGDELRRYAEAMRDKLLEAGASVNPYIMEMLGIVEENSGPEGIEEALELSRRLLREDRLEKIEV